MTFVLRCTVDAECLPELPSLLDRVAEQLEVKALDVDDALLLAGMQGERNSSWCPWPRDEVHIRVPGNSTRGASVLLRPLGDRLEATVLHRPLGTWTDWQLAVEVAACLGEDAQVGIEDEGGELRLPDELRAHRLEDEQRYLELCVSGLIHLGAQGVAKGEVVAVTGPSHSCFVGPRVWASLPQDEPLEGQALALVDLLRNAVEGAGLDGFREATPLAMEGRRGHSITAAVLAPEAPTLYRAPEYFLLSPDLEGGGNDDLFLLPFLAVEEALPGLCTWLDDGTVGVAAIPKGQWPQLFAALKPSLLSVQEALDGAEAAYDPAEDHPGADDRGGSGRQRGWWKLW